jgi:hypothetical protein
VRYLPSAGKALQCSGLLAVGQPQQQVRPGGPDGGIGLPVARDSGCPGFVVEVDPPLSGAVGGVKVQRAGQAPDTRLGEQAGQELGQELLDARGSDIPVEWRRQRRRAQGSGALGVPAVDG